MCSQKQTSYNEMRLDIFLVAHTKLRYRLIIQPTVQPQTPVAQTRSNVGPSNDIHVSNPRLRPGGGGGGGGGGSHVTMIGA